MKVKPFTNVIGEVIAPDRQVGFFWAKDLEIHITSLSIKRFYLTKKL